MSRTHNVTQVHNGIHHMPLGSHKVQCMIFPSDEKWLVAIGQCEFVTMQRITAATQRLLSRIVSVLLVVKSHID